MLIDSHAHLNFEAFVLDTRYSLNLLILMGITTMVGALIYILISYLLGSQELQVLIRVIKRRKFTPVSEKEMEQIAPQASGDVEV